MRSFDELALSALTLRALKDKGFRDPTPVQEGTLPLALEGGDLMVQSQTGTGKTAAFSLPLIESLAGSTPIGALILAPTRELARQVAVEFESLATHQSLSAAQIYGGTPFDPQVQAL